MEDKSEEGFPLRFFQDTDCTTLVGEAIVSGSSSVKEIVDPEAAGRIDPLGLYPQHVVQVFADGVGIDICCVFDCSRERPRGRLQNQNQMVAFGIVTPLETEWRR